MKQTICTIPVTDVFLEKNCCPFCSLSKKLENSYVSYITGDAKMEPTVRIATNKTGFCRRHLQLMLENGGRLSNALILESHLQYIIDNFFSETESPRKIRAGAAHGEDLFRSCYICSNVSEDLQRAMETTVKLFFKNEGFKSLYSSQPFFCLEHYSKLIETAYQLLHKSEFAEFSRVTQNLTLKYLKELKSDITHFCSMFDYRNAGGDFKNSRDSIERSAVFLNGPFFIDSETEK